MSSEKEQLEHLIVRHLDGELSADEELEFQRAILRDPDARTTLEEYERIDAAAAEALAGVLPETNVPFDPLELTAKGRTPRRASYHRAWWLIPAALAACLGGLMMLAPFDQPGPAPALQHAPLVADSAGAPDAARPNTYVEPAFDRPGTNVTQASMRPRRIVRDTDRQWIGVVGDDGEIYWIQLDQTRTRKGRSLRGNTRLASVGLGGL